MKIIIGIVIGILLVSCDAAKMRQKHCAKLVEQARQSRAKVEIECPECIDSLKRKVVHESIIEKVVIEKNIPVNLDSVAYWAIKAYKDSMNSIAENKDLTCEQKLEELKKKINDGEFSKSLDKSLRKHKFIKDTFLIETPGTFVKLFQKGESLDFLLVEKERKITTTSYEDAEVFNPPPICPELPFYQNIWFYISIILFLLLLISIKLRK